MASVRRGAASATRRRPAAAGSGATRRPAHATPAGDVAPRPNRRLAHRAVARTLHHARPRRRRRSNPGPWCGAAARPSRSPARRADVLLRSQWMALGHGGHERLAGQDAARARAGGRRGAPARDPRPSPSIRSMSSAKTSRGITCRSGCSTRAHRSTPAASRRRWRACTRAAGFPPHLAAAGLVAPRGRRRRGALRFLDERLAGSGQLDTRLVRSRRARTPSAASTAFTCCDTACWATCKLSAARETLLRHLHDIAHLPQIRGHQLDRNPPTQAGLVAAPWIDVGRRR